MANGTGKPKPAFFLAVLVVVAGLGGFAFYRWNAKKPDTQPTTGSSKIDMGSIKQQAGGSGSGSAGGGSSAQAENPDPNSITTTKEYSFEPATRLPEVPGTADYTALGKPRVVKFAVNVWAGWAPIIWANQGAKAKKVWKSSKGDFLVDLVLADNPVDMGNTFAAGKVHIGWATVDMLPLVVNRMSRDPRTMPRVFQQIDWSNGGDGIVVREAVKTVAELRGKNVVLAQNSPSHYFLLNMLLNGGV